MASCEMELQDAAVGFVGAMRGSMFRNPKGVSPAEEAAIASEADRIAALGSAWVPSRESLTEVVLAVKKAGNADHRARQQVGIAAARDRGVSLGRPRKEQPGNLDRLIDAIDAGTLSRNAVAQTLGVSRETLRRWINERKAQRNPPPREP